MLLYWFVFFIVIFSLFFISASFKQKKIAVFVFIFYIFLGSLRSYCVGTDTFGYILVIFPYVYDLSCNEVFSEFNDPFFYIIIKFIHNIIPYNFAIFTFIALIFWLPTIKVLKHYSINILLSILVLMILRYHDFYLSAMRLSLPLGMAALAMHFTIKGKFFKFIIVVLLASLFHQSSLILLLIYPFRYINILKVKSLWLNFIAILLPLFSSILYKLVFVRMLVGERFEHYQNDTNIKILAFLIIFFLFIFVNTFRPLKYTVEYKIFFSCSFLSLVFASILLVNGAFYRMTLFFQLSYAILVPIAYSEFKKLIPEFKNMFILILIGIFFVAGPSPSVIPYSFFWNPQKNSTHLMEGARAQDNSTLMYIYSNNKLPVFP